jgi:hypothetical protein
MRDICTDVTALMHFSRTHMVISFVIQRLPVNEHCTVFRDACYVPSRSGEDIRSCLTRNSPFRTYAQICYIYMNLLRKLSDFADHHIHVLSSMSSAELMSATDVRYQKRGGTYGSPQASSSEWSSE